MGPTLAYTQRPGHLDDALMDGTHEAELLGVFLEEWERCRATECVFVDVGAHVGHWTVRAAIQGIRVIAVEPHEDTVEALRVNVGANGVESLVQIVTSAAWDHQTLLHLDIPEPSEAVGLPPGHYGALPATHSGVVTVVQRDSAITVEAAPLDVLIPERNIGLVKIDVEGSEGYVLAGMHQILVEARPRLIIEMHDHYYGDQILEHVYGNLREHGYTWEKLGDIGQSWYLRATPPT